MNTVSLNPFLVTLDEFCLKQFEKMFKHKIKTNEKFKEDFILNLNIYISNEKNYKSNDMFGCLQNSDMNFCKYLIIPNDYHIKTNVIPITMDIYPFIRHGYVARNEKELPVLTRWVELPMEFDIPLCQNLICVLYTAEQLLKEHIAMGGKEEDFDMTYQYRVVSILTSNTDIADPMLPITMMRNWLGEKFGGNGMNIDENKYKKSVEYWSKNIIIK